MNIWETLTWNYIKKMSDSISVHRQLLTSSGAANLYLPPPLTCRENLAIISEP